MTPTLAKKINEMINELETITFNHHHYVRKTGLKRKIKHLFYLQIKELP